jgi:hypothetical protein
MGLKKYYSQQLVIFIALTHTHIEGVYLLK